MIVRERFDKKLAELRDDILKMGGLVDEELKLALAALDKLDPDLAQQVYVADTHVNAMRFDIEEKCFQLIVTQQPAAGDLRAIIAVMNMIVDLERMGDQTKGIAKLIPHMMQSAIHPQLPELKQMGKYAGSMLRESLNAYAKDNDSLAKMVAEQDDEVDRLFARVFSQVMEQMAQAGNPDRVEANYEILRTAQELERFCDLATNIAERVIYIVTGAMHETNVDEGPVTG